MHHLEEKCLSSKTVFSGKFLTLNVDTVELPDGRITTRDCIKHPGAVAVLPVFKNGQVVMVEQFRYATGRAFLEIPAGKIEPNQDIRETALRELQEETGLIAGSLHYVGRYYPCIGYSDETIDFFVALDCEEGERDLDEDENLNVVNMLFSEVVDQCREGQQMDSKTLAGVIRIRQWWRKNNPFDLDLGEL